MDVEPSSILIQIMLYGVLRWSYVYNKIRRFGLCKVSSQNLWFGYMLS